MEITAEQLIIRMQNEPGIMIIDVREKWENEENSICANCYPLAELPQYLEELSTYKNQEIIVYCKTGTRSGQARKYLTKQGFQHVISLIGGIEAYKEASLIKES